MAAFSYELNSPLFGYAIPPTPSINMYGGFGDGEMNASSSFPDVAFATTANASSSFGDGAAASGLDKQTTDSSSLAPEVANQPVKSDGKRKKRDESSFNSPHSKGEKARNQKNSSTKDQEERRKPRADKRTQKVVNDLPPNGYIHVRARRGQATDSHSIAERVRREKISERMKLLQGLVPGCDRVVGKALVLDEIINYVQSLQNQVEFLSMKLALHGSGVDPDGCKTTSQRQSSPSRFQGFPASNPSQADALRDTYHNYPLTGGSDPHLHQGQSPDSLTQENANLVWQMDMQWEKQLVNQAVYSNVCPFQEKRKAEEYLKNAFWT